MLSIGMFTYSTKPRGSVVHAASLAEAIGRAGHDVTLYALTKDGAPFFRPLICPVALLDAGEAPTDRASLVKQRVQEFVVGFGLHEMKHDVFHAQDCLAASALLASGQRPVLRTVHHVERFEDPYLAACQRRSILEADGLFTVSRITQRDVETEFGRTSTLVHNGVDITRFASPRPSAREAVRARYGVQPRDTLIVSVGGVEARKNSRRSLAALARLYEREPNLVWIIVGGASLWDHSEYVSAFERDLTELPASLAGRVIRTGPISEDDLTDVYLATDILLCPSLHEGFGLCVLEAIAAGTCTVVPEREPFTEYLDNRTTAFVDPESVDDMARALIALTASPEMRERVASRASALAKQFSWEASAALHVSDYETWQLKSKGEPIAREKGDVTRA